MKRGMTLPIYRDAKAICLYIENWIREKLISTGAKGAVLGVSGGVDSALLAGLLTRSLGADKVIGVIMPCHSMPDDERYALLLAEKFSFKTYKVDISASYNTLLAEIQNAAGILGEMSSANIKPRLRMTVLYSIAQQNGFLVCGATNKDELMYGYFTKHGDSGVDILPMADLLKGEVYAASRYIGVPEEIINRAPTAGLWEGQTDEKEMGLSYDELDHYLAEGNAPSHIKLKIETAMARSEHKRKYPPMAKIP